ncbi:MAG: hypothetical protein H0X33_07835 [Taibaiella sp.]|nr:hypothetical protein [Taibaiella sp.]
MFKRITIILSCLLFAALIFSCKHKYNEVSTPADGNYPPEVATIIMNRCAISGCHNAASYTAADNLLLDTWDHLFNGDINGAMVVPYSTRYSVLLYYLNTDPTLGPTLTPTMPINGRAPQLTKAEYTTMYNWIANGAPDKNGNIPFASAATTRQKIYATCQDAATRGTDLMAVIDCERNVIMRYLTIGIDSTTIESAHNVRVSNDGKNAYVCFYNNGAIQRLNASTDQIETGNNQLAALKATNWSIMCLSDDNTKLLISDWISGGSVATVPTATMLPDRSRTYAGMNNPHGIVANRSFDTFFVTANEGNCIFKLTDPLTQPILISLDGSPASDNTAVDASGTAPHPHDIVMSPDFSRYYVTCEKTNDVRVMDAYADTLIKVIPVGTFPQELAISTAPGSPYLLVTCLADVAHSPADKIGSVYVINYQTNEVVTAIYGDFYKPHAIAIDDKNGKFYVFSENLGGSILHHATGGNLPDGWYSIYNMGTWTPYNTIRYEMKAFPYAAAARFKGR